MRLYFQISQCCSSADIVKQVKRITTLLQNHVLHNPKLLRQKKRMIMAAN